jgi:hypothetical protein
MPSKQLISLARFQTEQLQFLASQSSASIREWVVTMSPEMMRDLRDFDVETLKWMLDVPYDARNDRVPATLCHVVPRMMRLGLPYSDGGEIPGCMPQPLRRDLEFELSDLRLHPTHNNLIDKYTGVPILKRNVRTKSS